MRGWDERLDYRWMKEPKRIVWICVSTRAFATTYNTHSIERTRWQLDDDVVSIQCLLLRVRVCVSVFDNRGHTYSLTHVHTRSRSTRSGLLRTDVTNTNATVRCHNIVFKNLHILADCVRLYLLRYFDSTSFLFTYFDSCVWQHGQNHRKFDHLMPFVRTNLYKFISYTFAAIVYVFVDG